MRSRLRRGEQMNPFSVGEPRIVDVRIREVRSYCDVLEDRRPPALGYISICRRTVPISQHSRLGPAATV